MQPTVGVAYLALIAAVACYGTSSLLLAQGAHDIRSRAYLAGLCAQGAAFLLAFVARHQVPLLVVQAAVSASVAVTALAGAALGRWRLGRQDLAALAAVVVGIALVGSSAEPGVASALSWFGWSVSTLVMLVALAAIRRPSLSPSALGALAGLAYGSSAIAARALAADPLAAVRTPIGLASALLMVAGLGAGQLLLTLALRQPGNTAAAASSRDVTAPVAAMYIAATLWPALAGLAWLGDRLHPGRAPTALVGVILALAGATVLSRWENPAPAP